MPTPPPGATTTSLQVGTYNSLNDSFTQVLNLNDFNVFWIEHGGVRFLQPEKVYVKSFNVRTAGEIIPKWQYKNRHIQVSLRLKNTNTATILSSVRSLLSAIENPPYVLRIAQPGALLYSYADVVAVKHNIPADPQALLALVIPTIQIDFECKPGLRGDRIFLQNMVFNPGFEAPSGAAVLAFSDGFANMNAYLPQQYDTAVAGNTPFRYYRLQDVSGSTAVDTSGNNVNGTYTGGFTLGQSPGPLGGANLCVTLNGTSGYLSVGTSGFPSGSSSNAYMLEGFFHVSGTPSTLQILAAVGNTTNGQFLAVQTTTGGFLAVTNGTSTLTGSTSITAGWHHFAGYYDGTNIGGYLDGTSIGTAVAASTTITIGGCTFGARDDGGASWFNGQLASCAVYTHVLSGAVISAHATAGVPAAVSIASSLVSLPTGAVASFGSPAWSAYNLWSIRFKWVTGLTATFYLHYTNSTNYLAITVNGATLAMVQVVAGVTNTINSATATLTTGNFYWMQATQWPQFAAWLPQIQVTVYNDSAGSVGTQVATVGPNQTHDAVTALVGVAAVGASGATLVIGGAFSNVHTVSLFGPGGWSRTDTGTGPTAMAWDGTYPYYGMSGLAGNTYPNGPVTSFGSLRVDFAPAGTPTVHMISWGGGSSPGGTPCPVPTGHVYYASGWFMTAGLSASATTQLYIDELNSAGTVLRTQLMGTITGNQPSWTQLLGTATAGANTQFLRIQAVCQDTGNLSPLATVWMDNVQVWDNTVTGSTTMPYCELRAVQSPGQLMVSGLLGDMPAPAILMMGGYFAALNTGHVATLQMGRRQVSSAAIHMVAQSGSSGTLDTASWGGYKSLANLGALIYSAVNEVGTFHIEGRAQTANASPAGVWIAGQQYMSIGVPIQSFAEPVPATWQGPQVSGLFTAQNAWTTCDVGQVVLPPSPTSAMTNPNLVSGYLSTTSGASSGGSQLTVNWLGLLPTDGELGVWQITNPTSLSSNLATTWVWLYWDGLAATTTYSMQGNPVANIQISVANLIGNTGTSVGQTMLQVVPNGDTLPVLDPTPNVGSLTGVNQYLGIFTDDAGDVIPMACDIVYSPLYLYPR